MNEKLVFGECEECGHKIVTPLQHLPDTLKDAERWRFFASSPQTALMLGSKLDPNDRTVDWIAECNRLAIP